MILQCLKKTNKKRNFGDFSRFSFVTVVSSLTWVSVIEKTSVFGFGVTGKIYNVTCFALYLLHTHLCILLLLLNVYINSFSIQLFNNSLSRLLSLMVFNFLLP